MLYANKTNVVINMLNTFIARESGEQVFDYSVKLSDISYQIFEIKFYIIFFLLIFTLG